MILLNKKLVCIFSILIIILLTFGCFSSKNATSEDFARLPTQDELQKLGFDYVLDTPVVEEYTDNFGTIRNIVLRNSHEKNSIDWFKITIYNGVTNTDFEKEYIKNQIPLLKSAEVETFKSLNIKYNQLDLGFSGNVDVVNCDLNDASVYGLISIPNELTIINLFIEFPKGKYTPNQIKSFYDLIIQKNK